ncbi:MAG TPA: RNA 2',3'-cyclic phosphodiesterase [Methanocella sp.]|uniref:RNA 2',3'-cyclic phosphodiesterase n=1 Tax=Methanocella sp. TaxID=2052833 RepID=UPI002CF6CBDB|nr:RNA 2',3'-cyclic phosphodiesterase [Methanocella sp.]HTY89974.1 RNA 2',3'-cyclic phosphodiesterase [Methanocella sp.]
MIRAFISAGLTPQIREKIGEAERDFDMEGVRLVEPSLIHVTLKFLGNIEESRVDGIEAALKKVTVKPFRAKMRSLGGFPNPRSPRVIWVGAEGDFVELNKQVEALMEEVGFPREGRFQSHVTIGRVKFSTPEQKQKLPALFQKYKYFDAGDMTVDTIHLMKSTLSPKGPRYDVLKEIPLAR